jgi:hypothetical protein
VFNNISDDLLIRPSQEGATSSSRQNNLIHTLPLDQLPTSKRDVKKTIFTKDQVPAYPNVHIPATV